MLAFFQNARVYDNVSTIVRLQIQSYYPPLIQKNILLRGFANKLVDFVVTPDIVANAAGPALRLSVKFAQAPTSIINNKVVIATAMYKKQAVNVLTDFGLPKFVVVNAKLVIDAVPAQLTLVNLEKRPNSILGIIIKIRTFLEYNKMANDISWITLIGVLLILFLHTVDKIKHFFLAIWGSFGVIGACIIFFYITRLWIMGMFLPTTQDAITIAQNSLVTDAVSYILREVRNIGIFYIGIAAISFLCWKFLDFEKLQVRINKLLHKLHIHIPTVTIKVK